MPFPQARGGRLVDYTRRVPGQVHFGYTHTSHQVTATAGAAGPHRPDVKEVSVIVCLATVISNDWG